MAVTLMRHPAISMHGPEHHFLVPAVLLAAYYRQHPGPDWTGKLVQARKRSEGVRGGSCGMCGNCGAGVAQASLSPSSPARRRFPKKSGA